MTVLAGMTVILVTIFFLIIILGLQIQIDNVMEKCVGSQHTGACFF
jgi:hypothetical protein